MTNSTKQSAKPQTHETEIKLYTLLVDQLLKYDSLIWQLPTALVVGNFLVLEKFLTQPFPLVCLALFNFAIIFVFRRMTKAQTQIMRATQKAEDELRPHYAAFLPTFPKHKIRANILFTIVLSILEVGLVVYIVVLLKSP